MLVRSNIIITSISQEVNGFYLDPKLWKSFRQAKLHVGNAVTLKYFNPIVLQCDASGVSISGALFQDRALITFISQALTDTQKRYSNIECELLALVVVVEHLHHYIFGRQFDINTDHTPLVNLFQKCLNNTSPRLQRLLLWLRQYQMMLTM